MGRRCEGGVGGACVARHRVDAHVAGEGIPELRRAAADRVAGGGHRRKRLPVDAHPLGRVGGEGRGLGDHHRHRLARVARPVGGQRRVRRDEDRRVLGAGEGVLVRVGRHRAMGDVREAVGRRVPSGQHREHARHGKRVGKIDPSDPRVRVRRTHEACVGLAE